MRIKRNMFLIEVDSQYEKVGIDNFFLDTDYRKKELATKIGRIVALPVSIDEEYLNDVPLNEGDTVLFNHTVTQDVNKYKGNTFYCDYFSIFAKIEEGYRADVITPIEKAMFCYPLKDSDKDFGGVVIPGKISAERAEVVFLSPECKRKGIEVGDVVYFTKGADYPMTFGKSILYKMHLRNILGIERDGKLIAFSNKMMVENTTSLGKIGGLDRIYYDTSLQTGVVVEGGNTGVKNGSLVTYLAGVSHPINWNGKSYSFIEDRNVKYYI